MPPAEGYIERPHPLHRGVLLLLVADLGDLLEEQPVLPLDLRVLALEEIVTLRVLLKQGFV